MVGLLAELGVCVGECLINYSGYLRSLIVPAVATVKA